MTPTFGNNPTKKRAKNSSFGKSGAEKNKSNIDPKKVVHKLRQPAQEEINENDSTNVTVLAKAVNENSSYDELIPVFEAKLTKTLPLDMVMGMSNSEIKDEISSIVDSLIVEKKIDISEGDKLDLLTYLINQFLDTMNNNHSHSPDLANSEPICKEETANVESAKEVIQPLLMEHIDASAASQLPRHILAEQMGEIVSELLVQQKINLNLAEQSELIAVLLNDMLGLGPLEPLLADDSINDIMVNGPDQVFVERKGKLELTDVKFRDSQHLTNIAQRIVTAIGRRVDESSPICDARLEDGSRVNVIIPPLAIDGASISIRKFSKQKITLDVMMEQGNISPKMANVLKIAAASRLNILISGGTGSGKTTMLNALSQMIDIGERVVTIEDAAELQLQQPHVVRLETRPPNLEGKGEVTMRDLVKNSLRMRPDRIILGEIRGSEAVDMLQAMNTGHDGSLGTIHANRPREALTRLENMVGLAGINLPSKAVRTQIADALNLIVQVSRMRDGKRRVQYISEVVGMEGEVITTQDLFTYKFTGEDENGELVGEFVSTGVRPHFMERAEYFGLGRALMMAMS